MGGRRSYNFSTFSGEQRGSYEKRQLNSAIKDKATNVVVNTALDTITSLNPTIEALYMAYKISRWAYETYQEASQAETTEEAVKIVVNRTVEKVETTVTEYAIKNAVSYGWNDIKSRYNISTNDLADRLVVSATTNTIMGVLTS